MLSEYEPDTGGCVNLWVRAFFAYIFLSISSLLFFFETPVVLVYI